MKTDKRFTKIAMQIICAFALLTVGGVPVWAANDRSCARYAQESVRQHEMNQKLGAGFGGPAWSGDYQAHYNWCRQGNNALTTPGHLQNRAKMLQEFAIRHGKDAARRYAQESVRQNQANQELATGFTPPVWSSDFNAHYLWSSAGNNLATTPGHLGNRERMLQEAAIKQNLGPTSPAMTEPAPKTASKGVQRTPVQQLQRLATISPGADPIVVAFMHTLGKSLSGAADYSQIERIMLQGIRRLPLEHQQRLMHRWQSIPANVRRAATPQALRQLTAMSRLATSTFSDALVESAPKSVKMLQTTAISSAIRQPNLGVLLEAGKTLTAHAPMITDFQPKSPDGPFVRVGDVFTIYGKNFSSVPAKTKIHFLQKNRDKYEHVGTVYPQQASTVALQSMAIAPGLTASNAATRIVVEVEGKYSAPFHVIVAASLRPTPHITSVSPSSQYPGNLLLVHGKQFTSPLEMDIQALDQQASTYRPQAYAFQVAPSVLSANQIEFRIPQETWSGHYKFNVRAGNSGYSNFATFAVKPTRYRVTFDKIHCIDEQDPEWSEDDEIVTAWVLIADNVVWTKGTGEYGGFSDNTFKSYTSSDSLVIPAPGKTWQPVKDFLYVRTSLYEADGSDYKAWIEGVNTVSEISAGISTALGAILGNPKAGKIAGDVIKGIGDGLAKLIDWIGSDADFLGSESVSWTAPELQMKTTSTPSFTDQLPFMNDDNTGSYNVSFTVTRNPE